jgi:hypothetical protein
MKPHRHEIKSKLKIQIVKDKAKYEKDFSDISKKDYRK